MNELMTINFDSQTASARELHEKLEVKTAFKDWFPRMCEYGFEQGKDFCSKMSESTGGRPATDYEITVSMAKEICMLQRTPKGKEVRQYLIKVEEAWNTPEMVFSRALQMAQKNIAALQETNRFLLADNERMKPKEIFADAVASSNTDILIGDLAKILRGNNIEIGQKRLFGWLREHGYLMKSGDSYNMPTQRAMNQGLFRIKESTVVNPDGSTRVTRTTKVTGKGQEYFINKFLG